MPRTPSKTSTVPWPRVNWIPQSKCTGRVSWNRSTAWKKPTPSGERFVRRTQAIRKREKVGTEPNDANQMAGLDRDGDDRLRPSLEKPTGDRPHPRYRAAHAGRTCGPSEQIGRASCRERV